MTHQMMAMLFPLLTLVLAGGLAIILNRKLRPRPAVHPVQAKAGLAPEFVASAEDLFRLLDEADSKIKQAQRRLPLDTKEVKA
ncbi:MAG: hypothetical protein ABW175_22095 [Bradyrhizobium sp.]